MALLPREFYENDRVNEVARDLLGKLLLTRFERQLTAGRIVETEAYSGRNDRACHANSGRRTARNEPMYGPGGRAYVYLCYGIHHLFNVVSNRPGNADAVLIRAIEPVEGLALMLLRRKMDAVAPRLTAGPGALSQALGIRTTHSGSDLRGCDIWIEDDEWQISPSGIEAGVRVGVAYAGPDALLPWRYWLKGSPWISPARPRYDFEMAR